MQIHVLFYADLKQMRNWMNSSTHLYNAMNHFATEEREKYLLNSLEIMWCYNTYADFMISLLLVIINDRTCLISIYDISVLYSPISQSSDHFSMEIYFFIMRVLKFYRVNGIKISK